MRTTDLSRKEQWREALSALQVRGWKPLCDSPPRARDYIMMQTPKGIITKVRILTRNHRSDHRYAVGPRPDLFDAVDFFVFYLHEEPDVFIVPAALLRDAFASAYKPTVNTHGQWCCNIQANTGELQAMGMGAWYVG